VASISDLKIIDLFSQLEFGLQPARLFPSACPSLGRVRGISILRKNLRVRAPFARDASIRYKLQLLQSLLKLSFFGRYPACQNSCDFQMQSPKLVGGHQIKIVGFHIDIPMSRR
jgi:hypothetical protein